MVQGPLILTDSSVRGQMKGHQRHRRASISNFRQLCKCRQSRLRRTPGDTLEVCLTVLQEAQVVGAFNDEGDLVGTIVDELGLLLPCLSQGVAFVADVIASGVVIEVAVRPASGALVERNPATVGSPPTASGALELEPNNDEFPAGVVHVDNGGRLPIEHERFCEVRALLRVGVRITTEVHGSSTVGLKVQ